MPKWRYRFCLWFFFLTFLLIISRLFHWQVQKGEELQIKAENQRLFQKEIPAKRGEIYTHDGYSLVLNKTNYLLFASLKEIKDKPIKIAEKLAKILVEPDFSFDSETLASLSAKRREKEPYEIRLKGKISDLTAKLSSLKLVWVMLSPKISIEKKRLIENMSIKGIGFEEISDRSYPEASTAAFLLGIVGKDVNGKDTGYFGLEGYYNQELIGQEGKIFNERDVFGLPILIGQFFKKNPRSGNNLILNLDLGVQKIIENELKSGILKYQAKGGTVIVVNPQNGAVIAMASFPVYTPNNWSDYEEGSIKNPAIADSFEPGSIFKPLIMAIGINEGKVKPTTRCDKCAGPREFGGHIIKTFNNQYHPNLTMTEVLENSDNTGMTFVGEKLGIKKIYNNLTQYGFGKQTGIDLQEEESGELKDLINWYPIDLATVTFGQGIAVTSIQIVQAMSALANGGKIYQPQVISKIKTSRSEIISFKPKFKKQIIKPQTSKILTEMLISTCEKSPLHFFRDQIPELKNYRIAAKSGTAQIPISGKYAEERTIGSVIGYAPADNPQFLVLVKLNEPEVNPWGANTAGPIFFNIIKELLIYYGISP